MAKPDVIKLLDDAAKALDYEWARGELEQRFLQYHSSR